LAVTPIEPSAHFILSCHTGRATCSSIATVPPSVTIAIGSLPNSQRVLTSNDGEEKLPNVINRPKDRSTGEGSQPSLFLFFRWFSSKGDRNNFHFWGSEPIYASRHSQHLQVRIATKNAQIKIQTTA
jgi:hypothetical protein